MSDAPKAFRPKRILRQALLNEIDYDAGHVPEAWFISEMMKATSGSADPRGLKTLYDLLYDESEER